MTNEDGGGYTTWKTRLAPGHDIPHYYGDYVRPLFILTAILALVATPLWGPLLPFGAVAQVGASLALVLLAGLTNAKNIYLMAANATVSAVSVFLLEIAAIALKTGGSIELFAAREVCALLMLGALYFSIKTMRGMLTGKIGHPDSPLEFEESIAEERA